MRPTTQPNYLLILLVAFVAAAAMWGGNRLFYATGPRSNIDQMAPTVERLALLVKAPTPQPVTPLPTRIDPVTQSQPAVVGPYRSSRWQIVMHDGSAMLADEEQELMIWHDVVYSCNDLGNWGNLPPFDSAVLEQVCHDMWNYKQSLKGQS